MAPISAHVGKEKEARRTHFYSITIKAEEAHPRFLVSAEIRAGEGETQAAPPPWRYGSGLSWSDISRPSNESLSAWSEGFIQLFSALRTARSSSLGLFWLTARQGGVKGHHSGPEWRRARRGERRFNSENSSSEHRHYEGCSELHGPPTKCQWLNKLFLKHKLVFEKDASESFLSTD